MSHLKVSSLLRTGVHNNAEPTYPSSHSYDPDSGLQAYEALKEQWGEHEHAEQHSMADARALPSGMKGIRLGHFPDDPPGPWHPERQEFEDSETSEAEEIAAPQMHYSDYNDEDHPGNFQTAGASWVDDKHSLSMAETVGSKYAVRSLPLPFFLRHSHNIGRDTQRRTPTLLLI